MRYLLSMVLACVCVVSGYAAETEPARVLRLVPCRTADVQSLQEWQGTARTTLAVLLNMDDQIATHCLDEKGQSPTPLNATVLETDDRGRYTRQLVEIDARPDRKIKVVLTVPATAAPNSTPAVVCIHGHGGNRDIVYDSTSAYRGFATTLAEKGYVTLSTDVGQHEVQDPQRTLMGERLWDLMRVVDLAVAQPHVDPQRIGCAGLSLGGEMAMWLGAMDTRIRATVSSGFLTTMDNLRHGHCMCWDFPGLQRRYEFADIYSLISPRALQCQNGAQEPSAGGFPVDLAQQALAEIQQAYRASGREGAVELDVHPDGHVFDVARSAAFLDTHLQ